jgi:hypothetical protein
VLIQQFPQLHAQAGLFLLPAGGEGGGHGLGLEFALVAPGGEVGQLVGVAQQGQAVLDVGLGLAQAFGETGPAGGQFLAQFLFQMFHVPMQAGQFPGDAGGQAQGFQGMELLQRPLRIGKAGTGRGQVGAEGAEAGLGPEQGHHGLGQLEVVLHAGEAGQHAGQEDLLRVGVHGLGLLHGQLAAGQAAHEVAQHPGHVVEQHAGGHLQLPLG